METVVVTPNAFDYVAYDQKAKDEQAEAKALMQQFEDLMIRIGSRRVIYAVDTERSALACAYENLQTAYAWIGKQIRDNQICRNGGSAPLQEGRGDE